MPLKVNGISIPWTAFAATLTAVFWLGGLSYQVYANADELGKIEDVPTDIALIKQDQRYLKDAVRAIAKALNVDVVEDTTIELDNTSEEVDETGG
jgi:hypothetical protein